MATVNLSEFDINKIPNTKGFSFAIITSQWNEKITNGLLNGALQTFKELKVEDSNIDTFFVPGSFELIYSANQLAKSNKYDAIITIGCVIKGETAHFDYVCSGVTQGVKDINLNHETPVIFCLLTDLNEQQSLDRSGGKLGNKGTESAVSAILMADFKRNLKSYI